MNPLCTCGCDVENTCHFLLHCPNCLAERITLLNKIINIHSNILNQADATITKTLLFGNSKYSNEVNLKILNAKDLMNHFLITKISQKSISFCLPVSLIKTIFQFERNHVFHFDYNFYFYFRLF